MSLLNSDMLTTTIQLAGVVQLTIVIASLGVPRVLNWKLEFQRLSPLNRHIFWTYAAYIFGTNLALAGVSIFHAPRLLLPDPLASAVCGYITLYWGARFLIQIFSFKYEDLPKGKIYTLADWLFRAAFLFLTIVFALALATTLQATS